MAHSDTPRTAWPPFLLWKPYPRTTPLLQVRVPVLLFHRLLGGKDFVPSLPLLAEFDAATAAGASQSLQPPSPVPQSTSPTLGSPLFLNAN